MSENEEPQLEARLSRLERISALSERLFAVERKLVGSGGAERQAPQPWWRDGRVVTVVAALIAAVLPAVTAVDGLIKNRRDYQRTVLEQQDRIRQTYLDRVLRPGVSEIDQTRLFGLLAKLKSDPEFRSWAEEELRISRSRYEELRKRAVILEATNQQ